MSIPRSGNYLVDMQDDENEEDEKELIDFICDKNN